MIWQPCLECDKWSEGFYKSARREGNLAVLSCSRYGIGFHNTKFPAAFITSESDLEAISKEILELAKKCPKKDEHRFRIDSFFRESDELMRKAAIYASFTAEGSKHQFPGYCGYCGAEVPIKIENGKLWVSCSPCATIIADGID